MPKTPRPQTDTGISIGQVFLGKYRVEELLGQGGMGIVARCTHLALNEQVAVKMLRSDVLQDEDATARFMREAQAAVKLRSEYVARVSDVGTFENGVPYMVMEFLDGHDLGALLEEQGAIAAQWATDLMLQACEALAEAHSINIVHRDVKPTNLFVTWRPDGTSLIKVLDFGISKSPMGTDMQLTQTQSLLGTPAYMSPEQMRSARLVDQRTDIWSLGTVLYELLEGRRPFEADSFSEMCVKVAVDDPSPMVNAPPGLQHVVLRCLAKSPEQRYANMAELGRDLIPFARDPHSAQMMVDRMFRMLGRGPNAGGWEGSTTGTGMPLLRTPVPGHVRDIKSGPIARAQSPVVRAQSPVAWHGGSDPAGVPLSTISETSARAPIDVSLKRSRSGLVIGLVAVVSIALGAVALFLWNQQRTAAPTASEITAPTAPTAPAAPVAAPADPPQADPPTIITPPQPTGSAAPPVTAVRQDDTKVDEVPAVKKDPPKDPVKDPKRTNKPKSNKQQLAKKPPPVEKTEKKDKDGKDKLIEPTPTPTPVTPPPKTKIDPYATPRAPTQK